MFCPRISVVGIGPGGQSTARSYWDVYLHGWVTVCQPNFQWFAIKVTKMIMLVISLLGTHELIFFFLNRYLIVRPAIDKPAFNVRVPYPDSM